MASGGARARSGPAKDQNAARRERKDDAGFITLPASGRSGEAPEWPLRGQSAREAELWESEWRRPQAIMWERNGQQLEVALYIRRLTEAELPAAPTNLGTLVRQMQEALGLNIPGMLRNGWVIADGTTGPQAKVPTQGNVIPARDKFRAGAGARTA